MKVSKAGSTRRKTNGAHSPSPERAGSPVEGLRDRPAGNIGEVVHDFSNLLMAISGYTDMMLADASLEGPARRYAEEIARAAERAIDLNKRLSSMSRRQTA